MDGIQVRAVFKMVCDLRKPVAAFTNEHDICVARGKEVCNQGFKTIH